MDYVKSSDLKMAKMFLFFRKFVFVYVFNFFLLFNDNDNFVKQLFDFTFTGTANADE